MSDYRIGKHRGKFVLVYNEADGKRRRYTLDSGDARGAEIEASKIYATLTKPRGTTVAELWRAFVSDRQGRAIIGNMQYNWKALAARFGSMPGDTITVADCRAYVTERRTAGIKDGTIATELGRLR